MSVQDKINKIKNKEIRIQEKAKEKAKRKEFRYNVLTQNVYSTTKLLVWFFSLNSAAWIWCSYILAFLDKTQIAESLSNTVCTIVIGQMVGYLLTKTVENIFKYNDFGIKSAIKKLTDNDGNVTEEVVSDIAETAEDIVNSSADVPVNISTSSFFEPEDIDNLNNIQ